MYINNNKYKVFQYTLYKFLKKKFKFFSEEVLQCMPPNKTCDSLWQMSTLVSVVTVNECPITERQPGTVHICIIVLYY